MKRITQNFRRALLTLTAILLLSGFLNFEFYHQMKQWSAGQEQSSGTAIAETAEDSVPELEAVGPRRVNFAFFQKLKEVTFSLFDKKKEETIPAPEEREGTGTMSPKLIGRGFQAEIKNPSPSDRIEKRPSALAGSWYPSDAQELSGEVQNFLQSAPAQDTGQKPRMIIVPHPGLEYGGPTAAYAYKSIAPYHYDNIYLIGVTHTSAFDGISLGNYGAYETPLGEVKVNTDVVDYFLKASNRFHFYPEVHSAEHSLEIQLPFLQTIFKNDFKIIPILLSATANQDPALLADTLYRVITPNDLVIISTDLSHYPAYEDAKQLDAKTLQAILTMSPESFQAQMNSIKTSLPENTSTPACGERAVLAGLRLAKNLNLNESKLLHYENSGDREIGDKGRVVGYGALAIYSSPEENFYDTVQLSEADKKLALYIARLSIKSQFDNEDVPLSIPADSQLNKPLGAFVTLKKNGELRGCVGAFEPEVPLYQVIAEQALHAALNDKRFSPLTADELGQVEIEISVLSPRKRVYSPEEVIPGKHGVYIQKGNQGGTYLPQVATDENWDRETMMNSLCGEKAGIEEEAWKDGSAEIYIFTALVFSEKEIDMAHYTLPTSKKKESFDQSDPPQPGDTVAVIRTNQGVIKIRLFDDQAPRTVENFAGLVAKKYYDGIIFHRVIPDFMIQGGDPTGTGTGGESLWGGKFEDEINSDLHHLRGAVSMANAGPNTNGSQFFIVQKNGGTPWLDGKHSIFGQVYEGMDVVDTIANVEKDSSDKPLEDVVMEQVTVGTYQ